MQHWQLHYCEHVTNLYCDHDSMSGSIYLFIEQKAESFIDSPRCQDGEPRLQELEHPQPRPQAQVGAQEVEGLQEVELVHGGGGGLHLAEEGQHEAGKVAFEAGLGGFCNRGRGHSAGNRAVGRQSSNSKRIWWIEYLSYSANNWNP